MFKTTYLSLFLTLCTVVLVRGESTYVYAEEIGALRAAYDLNECGMDMHVMYAENLAEQELLKKNKTTAEKINNGLQLMNKNAVGIPALMIQKKYCPSLIALIEKLSAKAGISAPLAFLAHNMPEENACASGLYNKNAGVIFLYSELFEKHDDETIEAIVAHELAHLKHNDTIFWKVYPRIAFGLGLIAGSYYFFHHKIEDFLTKKLNPSTHSFKKTLVNQLSLYLATVPAALISNIIVTYNSRRCESAADAEGLRLVDGNPKGFHKFFGKYAQKEMLSVAAIDDFETFLNKNQDKFKPSEILVARIRIFFARQMLALKGNTILRSHPLSCDRLRDIDTLSREYKNQAAVAA